jgi:hypothetical protein
MVMHVKEPLPPEYALIREGQIISPIFICGGRGADQGPSSGAGRLHRLRNHPEADGPCRF